MQIILKLNTEFEMREIRMQCNANICTAPAPAQAHIETESKRTKIKMLKRSGECATSN